jgi:hypothetical protein
MTNRVKIGLAAACLVLIVPLLYYCYRSVAVSLEAERTLHAYRTTLTVLTIYLRENAGAWPSSWEDLARVSLKPDEQRAFLKWPDDMEEFRRRITIDFSLTGAEVAQMNPESFSAVRQVEPNYGEDEPGICTLLRVARETNR